MSMEPHEVKAIRKQLGLTQQGLADALELEGRLSKDTVRSWEYGRRPISGPARVALRFMARYGVPDNGATKAQK